MSDSTFGDGLYGPLSPAGKARPPVKDADLRIAIYSSNFFNEDGVTLTCRRIISKVKKLGGKVVVLTTIPKNRKHGALRDRTMLDSEIIEIPAMDLPLPSYDRKEHECEEREHDGYVVGQKLGQRAMRELLAFDPQIMHITCPDGGGLAAISWAYRHNVPVMATWHSNFQDYLGFYPMPQLTVPVVTTWLWFFYMQIPIVLVPTAPLRLELASRLGLNPRRMAVWGRGINSRTFSPELRSQEFRAKYGVKPDSLLLCWSSRIVLEKRFDIFVEVVRRLIADGYDVHTMIAGKANDEMGLGQLKQVQSTLPNVSYIGWISAEQLAVAYASSDMLLFPSAVETFGNVTLEGMASGIPVIVDKVTGGHLVEDGLNGYTVQSGDVDGFYAAAKRLCAPGAGPLRAQLGAAGRKRATEHYDNEANTAEMLRHYREIIGRPTSSIKKLSLHWVWIDLFSNVVLGIFMIGVWILKRVLLLSVQLYGFSSSLKPGSTA